MKIQTKVFVIDILTDKIKIGVSFSIFLIRNRNRNKNANLIFILENLAPTDISI